MNVVSVLEMREIEVRADEMGLSYQQMLENAGNNLGKWIHKTFENLQNKIDTHSAVINTMHQVGQYSDANVFIS